MKHCYRCGLIKPLDHFYRDKHTKLGVTAYCKSCQKATSKRTRDNLPPHVLQESQRQLRLQAKYGMSIADYDRMAAAQNNVCAICAHPATECRYPGRLDVDHDHDTGHVRALLCGRCNRFLGMIENACVPLAKYTDYIEAHKKKVRDAEQRQVDGSTVSAVH